VAVGWLSEAKPTRTMVPSLRRRLGASRLSSPYACYHQCSFALPPTWERFSKARQKRNTYWHVIGRRNAVCFAHQNVVGLIASKRHLRRQAKQWCRAAVGKSGVESDKAILQTVQINRIQDALLFIFWRCVVLEPQSCSVRTRGNAQSDCRTHHPLNHHTLPARVTSCKRDFLLRCPNRACRADASWLGSA